MAPIGSRSVAQAFILTLFLAITSISNPGRADDVAIEGDLKTLQGEWISKDDTGESVWTFKGDKLNLKTPTREYDMTIKLKADAKPESSIDFNVSETSPNSAGIKAMGIYKIDGEKLRICFGGGDAARPSEFKMEFPTSFLFELKKKK